MECNFWGWLTKWRVCGIFLLYIDSQKLFSVVIYIQSKLKYWNSFKLADPQFVCLVILSLLTNSFFVCRICWRSPRRGIWSTSTRLPWCSVRYWNSWNSSRPGSLTTLTLWMTLNSLMRSYKSLCKTSGKDTSFWNYQVWVRSSPWGDSTLALTLVRLDNFWLKKSIVVQRNLSNSTCTGREMLCLNKQGVRLPWCKTQENCLKGMKINVG